MATLLLADDSFSMARTVEQAFAQEDVRVSAVLSGERALAALEADPPAVVVADIGMARVNGYDIASYIKHSPALAHIPVLLLTGPFDRVDEEKARATGCDGIVVKPLEPRLLVEIVRGLIAGHPIDRSLLWPADMPRVESWESASNPVTVAESPEALFGWKASRAGLPEPAPQLFDSDLDRLDEAFANGGAPPAYLNAAAAAEFESDLTMLRGNLHGGARRSESTQRPAPVMSSPAMSGSGPDARTWIPEPPRVELTPQTVKASRKEKTSEKIKIKVKMGSVEFQAEGPAELVQAQFEEFKRMTGTGSAPTLHDAGNFGSTPKHRVVRVPRLSDARH